MDFSPQSINENLERRHPNGKAGETPAFNPERAPMIPYNKRFVNNNDNYENNS